MEEGRVIVSNFSKAFVQKRLKEHRENVLFDREKALLLMSQVFVDEYVAAKEKKERLSRLYCPWPKSKRR